MSTSTNPPTSTSSTEPNPELNPSALPSSSPHPSFRLIRAADLASNLPTSLPAPIPSHLSPASIKRTSRTPTLFLSGYIPPPPSPPVPNWQSWQSSLSLSLSHLPLTILDPTRPDWDSSWANSEDFPPLHQQINWELEGLENADLVVVNFGTGTEAPVTMLEFGLIVGRAREKCVVWCERGFRKGVNVRVLCERVGVQVWEGEEGVRGEVERRVREMVGGAEEGRPVAEMVKAREEE